MCIIDIKGITSQHIHDQIKLVLDGVESSMSVHNSNSEIAQFNQHKSRDWFRVSENLFQVVKEAQLISQASEGAFDVTIGNLIELWGFGKVLPPQKIPKSTEIERIREITGFKHLQLSPPGNAIRKSIPGLTLNLSAIAKGFAVDSVADYLDERGVQRYLVEIGGELRTKGLKQPGKPWLVAIERPETDKRSIYKIIKLSDMSMATSGDYRNYYDIEGIRFSHTINPFTGRPVENNIASVSVMHSSCMKADALATTLMSMGFEKGAQFAEDQGLPVLWILRLENEIIEKKSSHFASNLFQ
jgi:thiamine biosynthesis lipoprotein